MRRYLFAVALAAIATFGTTAALDAQVRFGLGAGPSFAVGEAGDEMGTGFNAQATAEFSIPLLPVGLRADALFQQFPGGGVIGGEEFGTQQQFAGTLNAVAGLPLLVAQPYITGGVGIYSGDFLDWHDDHFGPSEDPTTNFGLNAGAGVRFNLLMFSAFAEARLHHVLTEGRAQQSVPVTIGVHF